MSHKLPKKSRRSLTHSYNLRSSCDGESCEAGSNRSRSSARQKKRSKQAAHRRRPTQVNRASARPRKIVSRRVSGPHRPRSHSSRDTSSSSSRSSSLPRRSRKSLREPSTSASPSRSTSSGSSASPRCSRRSINGLHVSFNLPANTTAEFNSVSPLVRPAPASLVSALSRSRSTSPSNKSPKRSRNPDVIAISPSERGRRPSPPPQSMPVRVAKKLKIEGELTVKTITIFYFREQRLIIDSQVMVMPKNITEEEMNWQEHRLRVDKKVYVHAFADGDDEMELMEVSVMTSDRAIFIRRVSEMSLVGKTSVFSCHPMEKICPVTFGNEAGTLNLEDIYSVTRAQTSISRKEYFVFSFGGEKPNSLLLQQQVKSSADVTPRDNSQHVYVEESVDLVGTTLTVERNMFVNKDCWLLDPRWKENIVKSYSAVPAFLQENPTLRPLVSPVAKEEKKEEHLSKLETTPKKHLVIPRPLSQPSSRDLLIKNVGEKPAAWSLKTTRVKHFEANPPYGILNPGVTTRISLKFVGFIDDEQPSSKDRVDVVWRDVEAGTVFDRQLFLVDDIVIQKKVLPVLYNY